MAIKLSIHSTGSGTCALTGKDVDGLTIAFESEPACFLSKKAFWQILSMRVIQSQPQPKPETKPEAKPLMATPISPVTAPK